MQELDQAHRKLEEVLIEGARRNKQVLVRVFSLMLHRCC